MRKMKDSGIAWIGEIPEGWALSKLKHLVSEPLQYGAGETGVEYQSSLPRYIRITDITKEGTLKKDDKVSLPLDVAKDYLLSDGDILFARSGATVGKSFYYKSEYGTAAFAGYLIKARVKKNIDSRFIYYTTISSGYEEWKNSIFNQATIQNIGADKYSNYSVPVPPLAEQQRIADYLDTQCAKIDSTIAKTQQIIEKLKAYKQSVITEAVTKGLNPDAPMKDSGIEWIGEIPEHWEYKKLKQFFEFEKGKDAQKYTKEYIGLHAGEYRVYSGQTENDGIMGYVDTYDYDIEECLFTTTVGAKVMSVKVIEGKFCLSQNCLIMVSNENPGVLKFIMFVLTALFDYEKKQIPSYMQPSLRISDLKTYSFYLPDILEQQQIASYLDDKCAKIDEYISKKQEVIEKLTAYKKSLIFEVVTGKKEI